MKVTKTLLAIALAVTLSLSTSCHTSLSPSSVVSSTSLATLTTTNPGDRDTDGISDEIESQLIQRFAPIVSLHADEQYLPANVPWYLPRVRIRFNVPLGIDDQILNKGKVTISSLIIQADRGQISGLSASSSNFFLEQTDTSGGDALDSYRQETRKGTGEDGWVCYAHVRPAPTDTYAGMYDVQYIFFYAYNGDLLPSKAESAHEADMEHITVMVKKDLNTIYKVYYAAHDGEGHWYNLQTSNGVRDGYAITTDGRPIVYSALNSHASYPWAGNWDRGNVLPHDETVDGGSVWDCRQNVTNLGEKLYPFEGMQWIQFSGRWGEIGEFSFTSGPCGPAYQDWWDSEQE